MRWVQLNVNSSTTWKNEKRITKPTKSSEKKTTSVTCSNERRDSVKRLKRKRWRMKRKPNRKKSGVSKNCSKNLPTVNSTHNSTQSSSSGAESLKSPTTTEYLHRSSVSLDRLNKSPWCKTEEQLSNSSQRRLRRKQSKKTKRLMQRVTMTTIARMTIRLSRIHWKLGSSSNKPRGRVS